MNHFSSFSLLGAGLLIVTPVLAQTPAATPVPTSLPTAITGAFPQAVAGPVPGSVVVPVEGAIATDDLVALPDPAPVSVMTPVTPSTTPSSVARATPASGLGTVGGFALSGSLRSRVENWDWFEAPGFNDDYTFTGHQVRIGALRARPNLDIAIDVAATGFTNLPTGAIAPPPQGQLGLGAAYRAANGNRDGGVYLKQGFVRFKNIGGTSGSSARIGRFEWIDGLELAARNPTLGFLKTQRIAHRMIGTFGFTHVGRAFDGAQIVVPVGAASNFTGVVARPTEGVFDVTANDNIDGVGFAYGALSRAQANADWRLFGLAYQDTRDAATALKTDNRPLAARQADSDAIRVYTLGAHYLRTVPLANSTLDFLGWGALQGGDWGALDHAANAFALEAGYQPRGVALSPWLRLGYYRASGDGDPTDDRHGTFFTPLPTPRVYARFPFFNQMNLEDASASLILRPSPRLNVRFEAHRLRLASGADLWYAGGGAFGDTGSGFAGRPSGGDRALADLYDVSLDYTLDARSSLGLYYGLARGRDVIENIYPAGRNASFGFAEYSLRF